MFKTYRRSIAALTFFFFLFTQAVTPMPQARAQGVSQTEVQAAPEFQLNIPSDLGTIESLSSGHGPALIHIQTAHGNYGAQKKIQSILHYLKDEYGFKTLFIEGSDFKLDPEMLRFFPGYEKETMEVNDALTREAIVKGPELFLLEEPEAEAYGIENGDAYRANLAAFRAVLTQKEQSENFIGNMDLQIERLTSPYLSKDLRAFLKRVELYELNQLPLDTWFGELKAAAAKYLEIDLDSPLWQLEWPMLVRVFTLRAIEAKLDMVAYKRESVKFLEEIKQYAGQGSGQSDSLGSGRLTLDLFSRIEKLLTAPLSHHRLPDPETGMLFEDLVAALPHDFAFTDYPQTTAFIAHLVLQSELKSDLLIDEVGRLTDRIQNKLAATSKERQILAILKAHRLMKKLFALELTPGEYGKITKKKEQILDPGSRMFDQDQKSNNQYPISDGSLRPSALIAQLTALNGAKRVKDAEFTHVEEIDALFDKALEFYAGTKKRDEAMLANIQNRLRELGDNKAVVVTGGFHADPFRQFFTSKDYSYALITPKITEISGKDAYLKVMLGKLSFLPSTVESVPGAGSFAEVSALADAETAFNAALAKIDKTVDQVAANPAEPLAGRFNDSPPAQDMGVRMDPQSAGNGLVVSGTNEGAFERFAAAKGLDFGGIVYATTPGVRVQTTPTARVTRRTFAPASAAAGRFAPSRRFFTADGGGDDKPLPVAKVRGEQRGMAEADITQRLQELGFTQRDNQFTYGKLTLTVSQFPKDHEVGMMRIEHSDPQFQSFARGQKIQYTHLREINFTEGSLVFSHLSGSKTYTVTIAADGTVQSRPVTPAEAQAAESRTEMRTEVMNDTAMDARLDELGNLGIFTLGRVVIAGAPLQQNAQLSIEHKSDKSWTVNSVLGIAFDRENNNLLIWHKATNDIAASQVIVISAETGKRQDLAVNRLLWKTISWDALAALGKELQGFVALGMGLDSSTMYIRDARDESGNILLMGARPGKVILYKVPTAFDKVVEYEGWENVIWQLDTRSGDILSGMQTKAGLAQLLADWIKRSNVVPPLNVATRTYFSMPYNNLPTGIANADLVYINDSGVTQRGAAMPPIAIALNMYPRNNDGSVATTVTGPVILFLDPEDIASLTLAVTQKLQAQTVATRADMRTPFEDVAVRDQIAVKIGDQTLNLVVSQSNPTPNSFGFTLTLPTTGLRVDGAVLRSDKVQFEADKPRTIQLNGVTLTVTVTQNDERAYSVLVDTDTPDIPINLVRAEQMGNPEPAEASVPPVAQPAAQLPAIWPQDFAAGLPGNRSDMRDSTQNPIDLKALAEHFANNDFYVGPMTRDGIQYWTAMKKDPASDKVVVLSKRENNLTIEYPVTVQILSVQNLNQNWNQSPKQIDWPEAALAKWLENEASLPAIESLLRRMEFLLGLPQETSSHLAQVLPKMTEELQKETGEMVFAGGPVAAMTPADGAAMGRPERFNIRPRWSGDEPFQVVYQEALSGALSSSKDVLVYQIEGTHEETAPQIVITVESTSRKVEFANWYQRKWPKTEKVKGLQLLFWFQQAIGQPWDATNRVFTELTLDFSIGLPRELAAGVPVVVDTVRNDGLTGWIPENFAPTSSRPFPQGVTKGSTLPHAVQVIWPTDAVITDAQGNRLKLEFPNQTGSRIVFTPRADMRVDDDEVQRSAVSPSVLTQWLLEISRVIQAAEKITLRELFDSSRPGNDQIKNVTIFDNGSPTGADLSQYAVDQGQVTVAFKWKAETNAAAMKQLLDEALKSRVPMIIWGYRNEQMTLNFRKEMRVDELVTYFESNETYTGEVTIVSSRFWTAMTKLPGGRFAALIRNLQDTVGNQVDLMTESSPDSLATFVRKSDTQQVLLNDSDAKWLTTKATEIDKQRLLYLMRLAAQYDPKLSHPALVPALVDLVRHWPVFENGSRKEEKLPGNWQEQLADDIRALPKLAIPGGADVLPGTITRIANLTRNGLVVTAYDELLPYHNTDPRIDSLLIWMRLLAVGGWQTSVTEAEMLKLLADNQAYAGYVWSAPGPNGESNALPVAIYRKSQTDVLELSKTTEGILFPEGLLDDADFIRIARVVMLMTAGRVEQAELAPVFDMIARDIMAEPLAAQLAAIDLMNEEFNSPKLHIAHLIGTRQWEQAETAILALKSDIQQQMDLRRSGQSSTAVDYKVIPEQNLRSFQAIADQVQQYASRGEIRSVQLGDTNQVSFMEALARVAQRLPQDAGFDTTPISEAFTSGDLQTVGRLLEQLWDQYMSYLGRKYPEAGVARPSEAEQELQTAIALLYGIALPAQRAAEPVVSRADMRNWPHTISLTDWPAQAASPRVQRSLRASAVFFGILRTWLAAMLTSLRLQALAQSDEAAAQVFLPVLAALGQKEAFAFSDTADTESAVPADAKIRVSDAWLQEFMRTDEKPEPMMTVLESGRAAFTDDFPAMYADDAVALLNMLKPLQARADRSPAGKPAAALRIQDKEAFIARALATVLNTPTGPKGRLKEAEKTLLLDLLDKTRPAAFRLEDYVLLADTEDAFTQFVNGDAGVTIFRNRAGAAQPSANAVEVVITSDTMTGELRRPADRTLMLSVLMAGGVKLGKLTRALSAAQRNSVVPVALRQEVFVGINAIQKGQQFYLTGWPAAIAVMWAQMQSIDRSA